MQQHELGHYAASQVVNQYRRRATVNESSRRRPKTVQPEPTPRGWLWCNPPVYSLVRKPPRRILCRRATGCPSWPPEVVLQLAVRAAAAVSVQSSSPPPPAVISHCAQKRKCVIPQRIIPARPNEPLTTNCVVIIKGRRLFAPNTPKNHLKHFFLPSGSRYQNFPKPLFRRVMVKSAGIFKTVLTSNRIEIPPMFEIPPMSV